MVPAMFHGLIRARPAIAALAGLLACSGHTQARAQDSLQDYVWTTKVSTGFDYSSGKYGATTPTDIAFVPLTVQSARGAWTLKGSTGWMSLSGPALILDGSGSGSGGTGTDRKVNGISDVNLSATYTLEQYFDRGLYIDLTARVKLPSASFAKGLGTGKTDYAAQVDVSRSIGDFLPFVTAGYKINGSPATLALRNVVYGSVGVQYLWDQDIAAGVVFDFRQSSIKTSSDPQEGSAYLTFKLNDRFSMNVYGVVGFSSNSPKAGGGIVFTYRPDLGQLPNPH